MNEREIKISFLAQGQVEQIIKLNLDCDIPINEIQKMLNGGLYAGETALTTIIVGGNLVVQDDDGLTTVIGTVVEVNPELEYSDFAVEE